jgi:hypothetical protein
MKLGHAQPARRQSRPATLPHVVPQELAPWVGALVR